MLHDIVERAHSDPQHLAAKDLERELTYAQLIDEVARLGAGLRARGVREGDRVAVLIPNSVDFVAAALACLWVGAAFVPVAITDPESRIETIVADCSPALVVTSADERHALPTALGDLIPLSLSVLREEPPGRMLENGDQSRVAYMIYTSGTTGTPKGVQIDDAAFAAAVHSTVSLLGLNPRTRTLCVSPFHFDGSYANLFPTLVSGGTVVIRPRDALLFPRTFFNTVSREKITYSGFTPSYLRLLLSSAQIEDLKNSSLDTIALGGEAISAKDLRTLWSYAPTIRVFNRYGPTETTIAVTNVELTPDMIKHDVVTIGRPHPGVSFALVGEDGLIVEESGRIGELYIGGAQLMVGYWNNPELTGMVMRSDLVPGEIFYRTGDLVLQQDDGNYVYLDRADRVLKRSGVRISLIELSASINKVEGVTGTSCLAFDQDGELGIVAFVTTASDISALALRRAAARFIPSNMMPDRFELVTSMPMNKSNQLDESRLLSDAGLTPSMYVAVPPSAQLPTNARPKRR